MKMSKIVVMGAGSWGTALALLLAENGNEVVLWEFFEERAKEMQNTRRNNYYLGGVDLPDNITVTNKVENILDGAEYLLFSIPSQNLRNAIQLVSSQLREDIIIINTGKGIEVSTKLRLSEVIKEEILEKYHKNIVALSGPTHAEEVVKKLPTTIVAAGEQEKAQKVQELFSNNYFRVYYSTDITGVELGGALKNCIAIAAGIVDGLGYGDNTKAAVITRGLAEISRFSKVFTALEKTFSGLAGMGDLIVTCTSKHSRNRHVGEELGKGKKIDEILASMSMVAEGVPTIKAVYEISKDKNIDMPIIESLYRIIYENENILKIAKVLMERDLKEEFY
jgi:glycerol-3-phosphate dehydrogenase (NAD(P)+)